MAGLNIFVELHPVGCHPVERFPMIKPIRLVLLANPGFQANGSIVASYYRDRKLRRENGAAIVKRDAQGSICEEFIAATAIFSNHGCCIDA
jgi:hypothetical protein